MKNHNIEDKNSMRIYFEDNTKRNQFFGLLKQKFGTWHNVCKHFHLYKSRLERFRNGEFSIPYSTFVEFLSELEDEKKAFFHDSVKFREKNWGQIIGGKIAYKKVTS